MPSTTLSWNRIISGFARSGRLDNAKSFFDAMLDRDVVSWNTILGAYARHGATSEAREVFDKMPATDGFSWSSMLAAFAQGGSRDEVAELFDRLPVRELISWTSMLHSCTREAGLEVMQDVFWKFPCWDVVCWNEVVTAFAREGSLFDALVAFNQMPGRSSVTWDVLLQAFCRGSQLDTAAAMFHRMPLWSSAAWNSMIQCETLGESTSLFERMPQRDKYSWRALICACSRRSNPGGAVEGLRRMPWWDVEACNMVMAALASARRVCEATEMFHNGIPARDVVTWNIMVVLAAAVAAAAFERMPQHDIVSWNSVVHAYGMAGETDSAARLLQRLPCFSLAATNSVIGGYGQNGQADEARRVFDAMSHKNTVSWNSMVAAYVRAGRVAEAKLLFDAIPATTKRDVVSWNTMLPAYTVTEDAAVLELVEEFFRRMPFTSLVSWNAMLHAYACAGASERAEQLFQRMPERDAVSWNDLASSRLLSGKCQSAAGVVGLMDLDGCKPDAVSYICALEACGMASDLAHGRMLHAEIRSVAALQDDAKVATAVVSMYSRCAALGDAVAAFDGMSSRSLVSWTAMVAALAQNGLGSPAQHAFWRMELDGFTPDSISFIGILSACSHAGSLEHGWSYFVSMVGDYGIQPGLDHYACLVDLLGRAGNLEDAHELMDAMPFIPGPDSRTSLLSACRGVPLWNVAEFVPQHEHEPERDGGDDVLFVGILAGAG